VSSHQDWDDFEEVVVDLGLGRLDLSGFGLGCMLSMSMGENSEQNGSEKLVTCLSRNNIPMSSDLKFLKEQPTSKLVVG
jgi:hypothetical protein